jgi:hypothetical protein
MVKNKGKHKILSRYRLLIYGIVTICFGLLLEKYCYGGITIKREWEPRISYIMQGFELKANLVNHFGVRKCEFSNQVYGDSITTRIREFILSKKNLHSTDIGYLILSKRNILDSLNWNIESIYTIYKFKNIIFFDVPDRRFNHMVLKIAYNIKQDRFYLLNTIKIPELNEMLADLDFYIGSDSRLLRFCIFVSILYKPSNFKLFLTDAKDLYRESMLFAGSGIDLDGANSRLNFKVDLPIIKRNGENAEVTFYMAFHEKIMKIKMKLEGHRITQFEEELIGNVILWYGIDFRAYDEELLKVK